MKCAIVSLRQEDGKKKSPWDIFRLKRSAISDVDIVYATHAVTVYEIGYSAGELCECSEKKVGRIVGKCVKTLREAGVQSVYLTDEVLSFASCGAFFKQFRMPNGKMLFDLMLTDTMMWCGEKAGIKLHEAEAGVWQDCLDEHGYKVIESVCNEFKYVTLYTRSEAAAKIFADKLCMQTGLSIKVSRKLSGLNKCDFAILTSEFTKQIANENTIVIDESGLYKYRCKNTIEFSLPFGFNALMDYFDVADQRCMEFLFDACDINIARVNNIKVELEKVGCKFKKVLYKSHKCCDTIEINA